MGLNVELLEGSFAAVAPQGDRLVEVFYRNLFEDYPAVVALFNKVEMADQKRKLLSSLKLVVENLRRPEVLQEALKEMGARHVEYGAEEAHYPAVGATLLKSLAEVAGDAWTEEMNQAWADAYGAISEMMIAGSLASV